MDGLRSLPSADLKLEVSNKHAAPLVATRGEEVAFQHVQPVCCSTTTPTVLPLPLPTPTTLPLTTSTPLVLHTSTALPLPHTTPIPLTSSTSLPLHTSNSLPLPTTAPLPHSASATPLPLPPTFEGLTPDALRAFFPYGFDTKALSQLRYDLMRSLPHIYGSTDPRVQSHEKGHYLEPKKDIGRGEGAAAAPLREKEDVAFMREETHQYHSRREVKEDSRAIKTDDLKAQLAKYHCNHLMRSIR